MSWEDTWGINLHPSRYRWASEARQCTRDNDVTVHDSILVEKGKVAWSVFLCMQFLWYLWTSLIQSLGYLIPRTWPFDARCNDMRAGTQDASINSNLATFICHRNLMKLVLPKHRQFNAHNPMRWDQRLPLARVTVPWIITRNDSDIIECRFLKDYLAWGFKPRPNY